MPTSHRYLRFWRADIAGDVDDELRFHFEARAEELRARGLSPDEIERTISSEFGDVDATRQAMREIDGRIERRRNHILWWHDLLADLAYGMRGLRWQPAFAAATLVTLALGIGATTAMLTVARAALFGSVPFPHPEQLVHVWVAALQDPGARNQASYADLLDWRTTGSAFASLDGYDETNVTLTGLDEPVRLQGVRVTSGFLGTLGARPVLGRIFAPGEDASGDTQVAVISHAFWRGRLGADSTAIGRAITLDGQRVTVIGVMPSDFLFAPAGDADLWLLLNDAAARARSRSDRWLRVIGRLRDGVTRERASAELATRMRAIAAEHPETNSQRTAYAVSLRDEIIGPSRPLLLALAGAVALVLLVSCANVASLFVARALARGREIAVRVAIGARPGRLVRQLLTESVLVSALGGIAGAALAWAGVTWLARSVPAHIASRLPWIHAVTVDVGVLAMSLLIALATGVAFGIAPALYASRLSLATLGRREGGDRAGALGSEAWRGLIIMEIALTTVLLVGAGLMTRSVVALLHVDPGFSTEQVVTMRLALAGPRYDSATSQQRFFESLLERARVLPGVRSAGAVSSVPLGGGRSVAFQVDGEAEPDASVRPSAMLRGVAGNYFEAMGIPVLQGRALGSREDPTTPAIAVSAGLARRLFGSSDAVGKRVRFYSSPDTTWTIVGVVGDVRAESIDAPATPIIYRSHLQAAENRMTLVLRSDADRSALFAAVPRIVHELDPLLPVYQAGTMAEQVASTPAVYLRRYLLMLLGGFAVIATVLAAVGVYGVIAYAAARRARELGIRAALGATQRMLLGLILRQGARLAAIGIAVGLIVSGAFARVLETLLYGVRAIDPLTFGAAAALLAAVALVASLVPAQRAARVSPAEALRSE
jgi:predicted permease